MAKVFIGVIVVAFIVVMGFMIIDPDLPVTNNAGVVTESIGDAIGEKFTVEGEVYKAGTYNLPEGATMQDLIDAAGGLTSQADERCFYETAPLRGGKTYFIGSLYDATDVCNNKEIQKVNINQDVAQDLTKVTGITTAIANSIVSYRLENDMFYTIEDLLDVYGIGTATYRKIRNFVILHE